MNAAVMWMLIDFSGIRKLNARTIITADGPIAKSGKPVGRLARCNRFLRVRAFAIRQP
jgi:hypothetical protein